MHKEQSNGRWTQFKGELRHWGKFTDDDLPQIEGDYQKFEGTSPGKYGDQKENVSCWADQWLKVTRQTPRSDAYLEEVYLIDLFRAREDEEGGSSWTRGGVFDFR